MFVVFKYTSCFRVISNFVLFILGSIGFTLPLYFIVCYSGDSKGLTRRCKHILLPLFYSQFTRFVPKRLYVLRKPSNYQMIIRLGSSNFFRKLYYLLLQLCYLLDKLLPLNIGCKSGYGITSLFVYLGV